MLTKFEIFFKPNSSDTRLNLHADMTWKRIVYQKKKKKKDVKKGNKKRNEKNEDTLFE